MIIPLLNKPTISRIHFFLISASLLAVLGVSQAVAGEATVTWHSNQESDLAGYNLYYGKKKGFYEKSIDVGKVAQYTLMDLEDNIPYYFTLTAYDLVGNESAYSQEVSFTSIVNQSPVAPSNPSGPASGYALTAYTFDTSSSDPDGDNLQYQFDWGDKSQLQWGPASQSHQWQEAGSYCVKTRATDPDGALSDWSGCLNLVLKPLSYPVAASAGANGTISPVGEVSVANGTDQTFTIRADENCHVAEVMVDGKSVGPVQSYTFTSVQTSHTISAVFGPTNQLPVAEAGADQLVDKGVKVKLDGTASQDPDDGIASYTWRQLSGVPVTLTNPKGAKTFFTSPQAATSDTPLSFALTVTDHSGAKDEDKCKIIITANPFEDVDKDGINDSHDNCPGIGNSEQVDKDADGVGDLCDALKNDHNEWLDSDKDGTGDNADPDDDNDGLLDADEITKYNTDPVNPDTDGDGFSDKQEVLAGSDPLKDQSTPAVIIASSVYEDAEDGRTDGWEITDNDPPGASIANVFDDERQSHVIEFTASGRDNAFHLRNPDLTPWRNSTQFIIEWSMQFSDFYVILVDLNTTAGRRLLNYRPVTNNVLGTDTIVRFGLGRDSDDGQWLTIIRDLKADLSKAQPDVTILEINGLIVRGSGKIDDVKLYSGLDVNPDGGRELIRVTDPGSLVGDWSFEDGSGSVASDATAYGNNGSVTGALWTPSGIVGKALNFSGAGDRVQIPDSPSLGFAGNQMTLACWINANDLSGDWITIMHRANADTSWFDWQLYARAVDAPTANHPVFRINWNDDSAISTNEEVQADIVLSSGTWYHIAVTYDGSEMRFYIDGTLRGTTAVAGWVIPNGGRDIWIGGNEPWGEYFAGTIDEVRIFDRALNPSEIQALMSPAMVSVPECTALAQAAAETNIAGAGLTVGTVTFANNDTVDSGYVISQNPVAGTSAMKGAVVDLVVSSGAVGSFESYWPFEDGSESVVSDASASGNDGSVIGALWTPSGKVGEALDFGGAGDRVEIPDSPRLGLASNQLTLTCWINADDLSNNWVTILHRANANNTWFDWQLYARAVDAPTPNHPVFRINWNGDGGISANEEVEADMVLSAGTWYHIAVTYDGSEMRFYVDGALRGTTAVAGGVIPNGGRDIWIGGNEPWGEYFDGRIDEVRIFDRALNLSEIQALMVP